MPRKLEPHPTLKCPLHRTPLLHTQSGTMVVCAHWGQMGCCRYWVHLEVQFKVKVRDKGRVVHVASRA